MIDVIAEPELTEFVGLRTDTGVARAVDAVGGQVAMAQRLGVSRVAVIHWLRQGWVPSKRVLQIEQVSGVPRRELVNPLLLDLVNGSEIER